LGNTLINTQTRARMLKMGTIHFFKALTGLPDLGQNLIYRERKLIAFLGKIVYKPKIRSRN